jgi:hypothetical protein
MALPAERLWAIVENPALEADVRAGAAVALSASADDEGRARLRVVADATVTTRVRAALEAVAEEDDATLAVVLDADGKRSSR